MKIETTPRRAAYAAGLVVLAVAGVLAIAPASAATHKKSSHPAQAKAASSSAGTSGSGSSGVTGAAPPVGGPGAGAPKPVGTFKEWTAYTMTTQKGATACFISSEPKSKKLSDPKAQRGDPFFMVTRWGPGETPQPSIVNGFPQAPDSKTTVKIGSDSFDMFVSGDGAWMASEAGDKQVTDAMKKGATMTVTAQSAKGTKSTDRYSLAGFSAAMDKLDELCK